MVVSSGDGGSVFGSLMNVRGIELEIRSVAGEEASASGREREPGP